MLNRNAQLRLQERRMQMLNGEAHNQICRCTLVSCNNKVLLRRYQRRCVYQIACRNHHLRNAHLDRRTAAFAGDQSSPTAVTSQDKMRLDYRLPLTPKTSNGSEQAVACNELMTPYTLFHSQHTRLTLK